jgi:hypothetical protein
MRKKLVLSLPKELVEMGKNFVPQALNVSSLQAGLYSICLLMGTEAFTSKISKL